MTNQAKVEQALAEIAATLDKHGLVLAPSIHWNEDDPNREMELTLRPRGENEDPQAFSSFGRTFYNKGRAQSPFLPNEQEAFSQWKAFALDRISQYFNVPASHGIGRVESGVQIHTHRSFYDGPLSGLCKVTGAWGYYHVLEEYPPYPAPRVFLFWELYDEEAELAEQYYEQLVKSNWAHLAYDPETGERAGRYAGGEMPAEIVAIQKRLYPLLDRYPAWIGENLADALTEPGASITKTGDGDGITVPAPDYWFTRADTSNEVDARQKEIDYAIETYLDDIVEDWDRGTTVAGPHPELDKMADELKR